MFKAALSLRFIAMAVLLLGLNTQAADAMSFRHARILNPVGAARLPSATPTAMEAAPVIAAQTEPSAKPEGFWPDAHAPQLLATTAIGQAATAPNQARLLVLEEYTAATREQCRRYAWFPQADAQGRILTACKGADEDAWVALRPLTHDTMSPTLAPALGADQSSLSAPASAPEVASVPPATLAAPVVAATVTPVSDVATVPQSPPKQQKFRLVSPANDASMATDSPRKKPSHRKNAK